MSIKNELIQYCNNCIEDKIISGAKHKQSCNRFLKDLERIGTEDFEWSWDEEEVRLIVLWFSKLKHSKGILAGTKIQLTIWQKFIVCQIYGWVDKDGNRRFKKAFIEVGRKNAKSQLLAGVLLYEISRSSMKYGELWETYTAGIKKDQSKLIFNECGLMLRGSSLSCKFKILRDKIEHIKSQSFIKPLSKDEGKTGDGTSPVVSCLDEYHLHPTSDFYDMHDTGSKARKNALLLIITTAGFDLTRPCYTQEYEYCSNIINPNVDIFNDKYFVDILEMDKGDELTLENISKANPIVATYKEGVEGIIDSLEIAKQIPEKMTAFLTKTCNIWVQATENGYMNMEKWKKCEMENKPKTENMAVWVGFDMSAKIDLTSVAFLIPYLDNNIKKYYIESHSFIPNRERLQERVVKDKVTYDAWERNGYCSVTETEIIDQKFVWEYVKKKCEENKWNIEGLCFDETNSSLLMTELDKEGYRTYGVTQSHNSLNEATTDFREQVYEGNISYTKNPLLNFAMSNAVVTTRNQKIKIDKDATKKKIDPIDAILVAYKLAMYFDVEVAFDVDEWLKEDW